MVLIETLLLIYHFVPMFINATRGKSYYCFSRPLFKSRPIQVYVIIIQLFLFILNLFLSLNYHGSIDTKTIFIGILLIFFVITTCYDYFIVKEGVFEKGLILRGLMYEWDKIGTYKIVIIDSRNVLLQIELVSSSGKKKVREFHIDKKIGEPIVKTIDTKMNSGVS